MRLLDSVGRHKPRPRRVLLYGTHGIGKSTFGAMAPNPVFIPTEDGIRNIDVPAFPLCTSMADVFQAVQELQTESHKFETAVLDSVDWFEQLVWTHICNQAGKDSIAEIGFGKGYEQAAEIMRALLREFSKLDMLVILIAHAKVEKFENPSSESYDRYTPKVHKHINGTLQEWADEVLFANYKVYTRETDEGFGKSRTLGIGQGERIVFTSEKPGHLAKNRLGLPDELPLAFASYWEHVTSPKQAV